MSLKVLDIQDSFVHVDMSDEGKIRLAVTISNFDDEPQIQEFVDSYYEEKCVELGINFTAEEVLESVIRLYEMPAFNGNISIDGKPIIDNLRNELALLISKIDSLKYGE